MQKSTFFINNLHDNLNVKLEQCFMSDFKFYIIAKVWMIRDIDWPSKGRTYLNMTMKMV